MKHENLKRKARKKLTKVYETNATESNFINISDINLGRKWFSLIVSAASNFQFPLNFQFHPEDVLDMELMCSIVIKKIKAKIKTMSRDWSSHATLSKKLYLHFFRFINFGKNFIIIALSDKKGRTFR